jgi:hypothetical protein
MDFFQDWESSVCNSKDEIKTDIILRALIVTKKIFSLKYIQHLLLLLCFISVNLMVSYKMKKVLEFESVKRAMRQQGSKVLNVLKRVKGLKELKVLKD